MENMSEAKRYPSYRWVVLFLGWLVLASAAWVTFLVPSLAHWLIPELGLSHAQFMQLVTAWLLVAIFTPIIFGALGDRYGIRPIVAICAFVVAIAALARAFLPSFGGQFAMTLFLGLQFGALPNLPKLVSIWFPPRQVPMASGFFATAAGFGAAMGLITGPHFGGWQPAFLYSGIVAIVVAILWTVFGRSVPEGVEIHMPPVLEGVKRASRSKNIWILAAMAFLFMGVYVGLSANLPHALENVHGLSPSAAGAAASLLSFGLVAGNIVLPIISGRVSRRKPFLYIAAPLAAIFLFAAWQLAPGAGMWVALGIGGFVLGSVFPTILAAPVELPEIGRAYVGGAAGIMLSFLALGAVVIPNLVITPIVAEGTLSAFTSGFLVFSILLVALAVVAIFMKETGRKTS